MFLPQRLIGLGLAVTFLAAPAAPAAVTDFSLSLSASKAPVVSVTDNDQGTQTFDLDERFNEKGADGTAYKDHVAWAPSHRQGRTSYVLTLARHPGGSLAGASYISKKVDEAGQTAWVKGPWDAFPESVSLGCERVLLVRGRGERAARSLAGLVVVDAGGDSIYAVDKPGLGIKARISPHGGWLAYVDHDDLVTHDLATGQDLRDSLVSVSNIIGAYPAPLLDGIRDDGTVVFKRQVTEMSRSADFDPGEVVTKLFRHGQ
jgi:hypothetical protein